MLEVIKPYWQVISMTQFLKFSNELKEFSNWGHSLLFVSNKCDSQIWGTPLCFYPTKKKKSVSWTWSTLKKKKKNTWLSNISTFHFFDCLWRPNPTNSLFQAHSLQIHCFGLFGPLTIHLGLGAKRVLIGDICLFSKHRGENWLVSKIMGVIRNYPKHRGRKMFFPQKK